MPTDASEDESDSSLLFKSSSESSPNMGYLRTGFSLVFFTFCAFVSLL
jgi:hypothetical protein